MATPSVTWAQRPNLLFVTINVSDVATPEIVLTKDTLTFKGVAGAEKKEYALTMKFLKEIDTEKSKYAVRDRSIQFALEKAEEGPYWERLLETKTKQHWLKIDFNKWKNEDSEDEEGGGDDMSQMMQGMGGMGGMGGMPGMGGMGGMPGMGGMGGMPGMGGMGGMPGMGGMDMAEMMKNMGGMGMGGPGGMPGMEGLGDADDEGDSDAEELPDLE